MAASSPREADLNGMNDPRLKPRMLRSLAMDHLPDEKQPSPSPDELSSVLSSVKTHGLLSEIQSHPPDPKQIDEWRSSVDAWVQRLLSLVSSNMPDKCWAGICLLGVTFEECSSERFLASYSLWFHKLLSNFQPPSHTLFVKVASCASLADLFTRLAHFPNLKKDATSLAGKLLQTVLQLLNENETVAVWEGAIDLLSTLLTFFPSSVHRFHDNVEVVLVSTIMSAKCSANTIKKIACCLALLPKTRGDEDSWCLMMQKILIALNVLLNESFEGLEEEAKSYEMRRLLVPPGKDPPPPLGGQSILGASSEQATNRLHELLAPRVSALMQCCCMMLTNPYPVQVIVPIRPLLALVGRVLLMDGSLDESLLYYTTSMQQEVLCYELSGLHLDSLELLIAIIKGVKSQLLPHAANIVRLLTEYFRRATLPSIRIKVYSIMQILLISMGVGMALYVAQEVIDNAFLDLSDCPRGDAASSNTLSSRAASLNEGLVQCSRGKRKHANTLSSRAASLNEGLVQCSRRKRKHGVGIALEVDAGSRKLATPISVKIAALRALEALLTVGGSLRSESWRSNVDHLLITVATDVDTRVELQLAALEALLASLVSPAHFRPPYLSQGLELFRRGKQENTGTKLATFCAHALLALEVVIHRPSSDFPVGKSSRFDEIVPSGTISDLEDDDEDEEARDDAQLLTTTDVENTIEISTAQVAVASINETATIKYNGDDSMEPLPGILDVDTDSDSYLST